MQVNHVSHARNGDDEMPTANQDAFIAGGIFAVLGLYLMAFQHEFQGGFVLFGIGMVIMASTSEEFREKLFDFFLSIFKGLWSILSK